MRVISDLAETSVFCAQLAKEGPLGFVPTMGFLHDGHISLVKTAARTCAKVVVSIFVNPTQFGPNEDFAAYPRDLERDLGLLETSNCHLVFTPDPQAMYPQPFYFGVNVHGLSDCLCGKARPGHFNGVVTVLTKLVNLVQPDFMFMGEKDFQQLLIVRQQMHQLNFRTQVVGCPIIRENDGLALSSRNVYLNLEQRAQAVCLSKALKLAGELYASGERSATRVEEAAAAHIAAAGGRIDYVELRSGLDLSKNTLINPQDRLFLAVYFGKTRLIDNQAITG